MFSRRGFLGGLIAAPAIKLAPLMRIKPVPSLVVPWQWQGVESRLVVFRKEIFREYVKDSLFSPFFGTDFESTEIGFIDA